MSKRNKKWKVRPAFQPQPGTRAQVMPSLDLGYLDASVVTTRDWRVCQFIVVGGGGTGAYLTQHIGRMMRVLYQGGKGVHLTIVDPKLVEYKNIGRQLFCDAEEGIPKAEALARRYGQAWGLNVSSYVGKFDESLLIGMDLTILVGCVDNAAARRELHQTLEHNAEEGAPSIWWVDCGNLSDTGRVLLGSACEDYQLAGSFADKGKCASLPSPGIQSPGLLEDQPEDLPDSEMGCAEMAAANLQSLNINARIAAEASDFIARLLITKDLKRYAWEVNLAAGSARSHYTTPENVGHLIHKPASFLKEPLDFPRTDRSVPADLDAHTAGLMRDALMEHLQGALEVE